MSGVEDCWNFYNRAKTVFPFEGKIYNQLAILSGKENDFLALMFYYM